MAYISKIYTRAFFSVANKDEISSAIKNLEILSVASSDKKFTQILQSPNISKDDKLKFLLSFCDDMSEHFKNLLNLLVINNRLNFIKSIKDEFQKEFSSLTNNYFGFIYAKNSVDESRVQDLNDKFSKKFNKNIEFSFIKSDYNGLKIQIPNLGLEVSFSIDKLKTQLNEYLLKAI